MTFVFKEIREHRAGLTRSPTLINLIESRSATAIPFVLPYHRVHDHRVHRCSDAHGKSICSCRSSAYAPEGIISAERVDILDWRAHHLALGIGDSREFAHIAEIRGELSDGQRNLDRDH
jgi:hypothetical protein